MRKRQPDHHYGNTPVPWPGYWTCHRCGARRRHVGRGGGEWSDDNGATWGRYFPCPGSMPNRMKALTRRTEMTVVYKKENPETKPEPPPLRVVVDRDRTAEERLDLLRAGRYDLLGAVVELEARLVVESRRLASPPSVQPEWCRALPLQQQSVLFLAARGPDGIAKGHPCKVVHVAYRGTTIVAAKYGRPLAWGERADGFMSLEVLADPAAWGDAVARFFDHHDSLPHHYLMHLMHGAEIVGYKHPDERFRERWRAFYLAMVESLHVGQEPEYQMDARLGDWARAHWGLTPDAAAGTLASNPEGGT